jgi:hypothetical protein
LFVIEVRSGGGSGQDSVTATAHLCEDHGVELLAHETENFEDDDEEGDADAGGGHHAAIFDLPGFGEEACIDSVPVPEHLSVRSAPVSGGAQLKW